MLMLSDLLIALLSQMIQTILASFSQHASIGMVVSFFLFTTASHVVYFGNVMNSTSLIILEHFLFLLDVQFIMRLFLCLYSLSGINLPIVFLLQCVLNLTLLTQLFKLLILQLNEIPLVGKSGLFDFKEFLSFEDLITPLQLLLVELVVSELQLTLDCCDIRDERGFRVDVILLHLLY